MAERCSITKLIMVSASVSFLFTALPHSQGQLKMYVRDMNRVQVPTPALLGADGASSSLAAPPALSSKQFHELRQRLCAEHYATNTVFIHVREMEQLVPPLYLQPPTTSATPAGLAEEGSAGARPASPTPTAHNGGRSRSRRGRRSRAADEAAAVAATAPAAPPPLPALSPVERLLALQAWKKAAATRAKESQARYPVPAHFHAITRVRFHDPHQTDLTVAMGGGWDKSTASVLRAIVRSVQREEQQEGGEAEDSEGGGWGARAEEMEDEESDNSLPPFPLPDFVSDSGEVLTEASADVPESSQPAFQSSPYAVKPLLTVCASCVPRREAWIGTCSPNPSMLSTAMTPEARQACLVRRLPAVPRFSTRITIMLEHDDMDPADLVSLAEISTTRKPALASAAVASRASSFSSPSSTAYSMHADVSVKGGGVEAAGGDAADLFSSSLGGAHDGQARTKRPVQLYCFVQDAGEY